MLDRLDALLHGQVDRRDGLVDGVDDGVLLLRLPGAADDAGIGFGLDAQGLHGARGLRERRREEGGRLRHGGLHGPGELGEENLTGLEVGELLDLSGVEDAPVHVRGLEDEQRVVLGEVLQPLGTLDRIALDERDRARPGEQLLEALDTGLAGGPLGERVLHHRVVGDPLQGAAQLADLGHGEAAVLGEHGGIRRAELLGELRYGGGFVVARHALLLLLLASGPVIRTRAQGRPRSGPTCAGRPRPGASGTFGQPGGWRPAVLGRVEGTGPHPRGQNEEGRRG